MGLEEYRAVNKIAAVTDNYLDNPDIASKHASISCAQEVSAWVTQVQKVGMSELFHREHEFVGGKLTSSDIDRA